MDLACVVVLALASGAAGSLHPGGYGVKAGAAAKAEASAVSGAFGGPPAPATLSGAGGGAYSSSFSKSSASSFASSSASSSSYSYSGGYSGGVPGGINGIGGAGCGGGTGCQHNAGAATGSGAYSGLAPFGGPNGPGPGTTGSATGAYAGSNAAGISSVGSNHGTAGSGSTPFSGSTSIESSSPDLNNGPFGSKTGSYSDAGINPSRPTLGSPIDGSSQYSSPSLTGSNFGSNSNSAAIAGTSLFNTDSSSKYPTDANKRPCSGDCGNSGSSLSQNCEGTNCDSSDSKCTSSQCQSNPTQEVSPSYNNYNDIPVSISGSITVKPTSVSSDISPNEKYNKPNVFGSQCDTPNCNSNSQSNNENLYDRQYTSYNPKPSTYDASVYGGQPHMCTSPSCTQSPQHASSTSSSSQSTSQLTPSSMYSTSAKETPKESTTCNSPNCDEEKKKPNSYESSVNGPQTGSSKPHKIYPELTPSKGSPCGLANCDGHENTYPYTSGNVLPLTPTYNQNTNYKPSDSNCGVSGCGTPNDNLPSTQDALSSSPKPSVPNCGTSGCGTPNYSTPPGNSYFSSNSQNTPSSSSTSQGSYFSSSPHGPISSTLKPSVPNCGPSGCGAPNYNIQSENPYFSSSLPSSSPNPSIESFDTSLSPQKIPSSGSKPIVTNCGASGCGAPNYSTPPGNSYFSSNSQNTPSSSSTSQGSYYSSSPHGPISSTLKPSVPNCGPSGCGAPNYNIQSEKPYFSSSLPSSSANPAIESFDSSLSPQSIPSSGSKPIATNCGASGCGAPHYNVPSGNSHFPSSLQGSSSPSSVSGSSYFPSSVHGPVSPVSQGLTPPKPVAENSYFSPNFQGSNSFPPTAPGTTYSPSTSQGSSNFAPGPSNSHFSSTPQGSPSSSPFPFGQGVFGCGQAGGCGYKPLSSTNIFGTSGASSGSHAVVKPISNSNNKGPTYTGGFGAPSGVLKPNDYSLPAKPEYMTSQQPVVKPTYDTSVNHPSSSTGIDSGHVISSSKPITPVQLPVVSHNSGSSVSATAGANAAVYTGGFGGPPGLLKPYDNGEKPSSIPYHQRNAISGVSGSNYDQGSAATGSTFYNGANGATNPSFRGSISGAGATAMAGAGATAVTNTGTGISNKHDVHNKAGGSSQSGSSGHGGCAGGCGSAGTDLNGGTNFDASGALSKGPYNDFAGSLNTAGAAAKSSANAVSATGNGGFGTGGSFASSSATAHASASAGTKGGYGKR